MTDKTTIARPYAKAAFEEARGGNGLASWSAALRTAAALVRDPGVSKLLDNPGVTTAELGDLVVGIAGTQIGDMGSNLLRMLAENRRLAYLPEISALFDELKDAAEGVVDVTVTSAAPLDPVQQQTLTAALVKRLKREVRLHCDTDPALIGGAVLKAGDLVIDGSLRTRLQTLTYQLMA